MLDSFYSVPPPIQFCWNLIQEVLYNSELDSSLTGAVRQNARQLNNGSLAVDIQDNSEIIMKQ